MISIVKFPLSLRFRPVRLSRDGVPRYPFRLVRVLVIRVGLVRRVLDTMDDIYAVPLGAGFALSEQSTWYACTTPSGHRVKSIGCVIDLFTK